MEPEKLLKDYVASIEVPNSVKPDAVRDMILQDNELTAGTFLKSLRQLKISGSEFLDLLGNSRIGNSEYRYIEENPHLRFDELLTVLDNSVLTSEDYRVLLAAATHRKKLRDERRRREQEAVARLQRDRALAEMAAEEAAAKSAAGIEPVEAEPAEIAPAGEVPTEAEPAEITPTEKTPIEAPIEEVPVESTPVEAAPVEIAPAEETPIEEVPVDEAHVKAVSVGQVPAEKITAEITSIEGIPTAAISVEAAIAGTTHALNDIISEISDMLVGASAVGVAPVEVAPIEETPAETVPAEEVPVEETPIEEAPAEAVPAEETPIEAPIEEAPAEETPIETSTEEVIVEEVQAEETPSEATPTPTDIISEISDMLVGAPAVGLSPVEGTPVEVAPIEEAPAETVPAEEVPTEDTFAEAVSVPAVEVASVEVAPIEETPAETVPVEESTTESAPVEAAPVEAAPVEETSTEVAPIEVAPVEETPIETPTEEVIAEEAPIEEAPIEEAPVEAAPVEETSTEEAAAKSAEVEPAEIAPAEKVPVEETPAEVVSVEATPTEPTPAEDTHEEQAPAKEAPTEESEEDWEYEIYDNDSFYDDDGDYSAKSLARSVGELVEKREGRAKNCLIAAFSLAAAVLVFGVGFKLLKFYQVLPTYTYEIPAAPEEFSQQITNDKELLECARTPDEAVSYLSAAESPARAEHTYEQSKTAFSPKYVLRVCDNGKGKLVIKGGSINDKGKVESKFTADVFDDDITDLNIFYKEYDDKGYFILAASAGDETCVKIYEQDALRQLDAPTVDYRQSGAMLDYYIGEDAFYPISYIEFDVDKANSGKPETFVPHIYNNDRSRAAAFNDIVLPYAVARLKYYVVSRLPMSGGNDCFVKASAVGENSGWAISSAGLYTSDTVKVNGDTHTRLTRICFDKSLTPSQYDLDGAVYPEMIAAGETKLAVLGKNAADESVLYVFPSALSEPSAVDNIAENKSISDIFCEGDILSVITAEEKPMQYSLDLNTLKSCEPADNSLIFIKDGLYAKAEVSDKGVKLSVCIDKNTELASVDISEKGGTGYRLPSNADAVVTGISGDNVIIGVPVVYYDGVTDVGKYQFYTYKDKKLSPLGAIIVMEGDLSFITGAVTDGGYIVTVWGSRVITADSAKLKIISDASL